MQQDSYYQQPYASQPQPPKKKKTGLVVLFCVLGAALVAAIAVIVLLLLNDGKKGNNDLPGSTTTPQVVVPDEPDEPDEPIINDPPETTQSTTTTAPEDRPHQIIVNTKYDRRTLEGVWIDSDGCYYIFEDNFILAFNPESCEVAASSYSVNELELTVNGELMDVEFESDYIVMNDSIVISYASRLEDYELTGFWYSPDAEEWLAVFGTHAAFLIEGENVDSFSELGECSYEDGWLDLEFAGTIVSFEARITPTAIEIDTTSSGSYISFIKMTADNFEYYH